MLVVETGTGASDSESYVSVSDAASYAAARGLTFPVSPEAPAEQALRRATTFIDATYRASFPGARANGRNQALQWPRVDAYDREGEEIASDEIPAEIVSATIEAAVRELASPGSLSPDIVPGQIEKRIKVDTIEFEYAVGAGTAQEQRPVVSIVDDILSGLLAIKRGPVLFGTAVRA
ncbi:MAG: hypothetical protein H6877_10190 [Rhodobiaceae bacterium]|nr:hypothetical protein [Rhodobiaceae bacterium]